MVIHFLFSILAKLSSISYLMKKKAIQSAVHYSKQVVGVQAYKVTRKLQNITISVHKRKMKRMAYFLTVKCQFLEIAWTSPVKRRNTITTLRRT